MMLFQEFKLLLALLAFLTLAQAGTSWIFYYDNQGRDWGEVAIPPDDFTGRNKCGDLANQSPVNLYMPVGPYGWPYGPAYPTELDNHFHIYLNPKPGSKVIWYRKNLVLTLKDNIPKGDVEHGYYTTNLTRDIHDAPSNKLEATKFHFHVPSEHTFEGERVDAELHVNHNFVEYEGSSHFREGLVAIRFSITDYDQSVSREDFVAINNFFEDLQLDGARLDDAQFAALNEVTFASAMDSFDYLDRYVYIGSKMKPPCETFINWTVLRKIYPIEKRYVRYIRDRLTDHEDELRATSNIRGLRKVHGHQIFFIGARPVAAVGIAGALGLLLSLL